MRSGALSIIIAIAVLGSACAPGYSPAEGTRPPPPPPPPSVVSVVPARCSARQGPVTFTITGSNLKSDSSGLVQFELRNGATGETTLVTASPVTPDEVVTCTFDFKDHGPAFYDVTLIRWSDYDPTTQRATLFRAVLVDP
jgi:hypothetical protein